MTDDVGVTDAGTTDAGAALDPTEIEELLAGLEHRPVGEHVAVYDQVHQRLRDHLSGDSP